MQRRYLMLVLFLFLAAQGCSSIMPYSGNFTCPKTANGKCMSVSDAYEESLKKVPQANQVNGAKDNRSVPEDSAYKKELLKKLAGLLKEPTTPMVRPATVMRVLFTYYPGDEAELYSYRYAYFFADTPAFVLGDYLKVDADNEGEDK